MNTIKDAIKDEFLLNECNTCTHKFLEAGLPINTICKIVKAYQREYLLLKKENPLLAKEMPLKVWWERKNELGHIKTKKN